MSISPIPTVLIVDDEPLILQLMASYLEDCKYTIYTAENAKSALEILSIHPVDLMITDYAMPDVTGLALCLEVRQSSPTTRLIICSGYNSEVNDQNIAEFGIDYFFQKPVSLKLLSDKLETLLTSKP